MRWPWTRDESDEAAVAELQGKVSEVRASADKVARLVDELRAINRVQAEAAQRLGREVEQ